MGDSGRKTTVEQSKAQEKAFTLDINLVKKNQQFMIESWIYIFDNVCLTKMKQSKDCFRKKIVKFYKNYFPEYQYFKDWLPYPDFSTLPPKKNYLERIKSSIRFYKPSYQQKIDLILNDRNFEDGDEFYDIVYQFKKLVKDLLEITYNSFYNESLILKDSLILEFCYQQLKYLEMEYFYCRMAFEIKNKNYVQERITCIIRRMYHFWVELLFETYCWYERKRYSRNDLRSKLPYEEERFLQNNKGIEERLEKYRNFHNLGKKQLFFDQKNLPREEIAKKTKTENEMYEFSFEEFCQQDEYDDQSLYVNVPMKERNFNNLQGQAKQENKMLKFDLKIGELLDYYPFINRSQSDTLEVKQIYSRMQSSRSDQDDTYNFLKHIEMLVEINVKVLHEFLFSEHSNWNQYEQQYIMIIQLYSFLQRVLRTKSILISIVETYNHFKDTSGCDVEFVEEDDQSNYGRQNISSPQKNKRNLNIEERRYQKGGSLNQQQRKKPWWWRKLGAGIIDEEIFDEDLDFQGADVDRIYDRESKAIERIINKIVQQNNQRLLQLIRKYFKSEFDSGLEFKEMYPLFLNDSIVLQKYEFLLEDALAFDLTILICQEQSKNFKQETRSETQFSPQNSMKKQEEEISGMKTAVNDKDNNQNDNSFDQDDEYDEKEYKSVQEFFRTSFQTKHQSKRYIMPLPYQDLTFAEQQNSQVILTEFKDSVSSSDPYFDDFLVKNTRPQKLVEENNPQRLRSGAMSTISEGRNQLKSLTEIQYYSKEDIKPIDIIKLREQAKNIREVLPFESVRGGYPKQTNILDEYDYLGAFQMKENEQSKNK